VERLPAAKQVRELDEHERREQEVDLGQDGHTFGEAEPTAGRC
jgi:hypothetical protein